jgi:hypothetical protein
VNISTVAGRHMQNQINYLTKFRDENHLNLGQLKSELKATIENLSADSENEQYVDFLIDEHEVNDELKKIGDTLLIVGLYRIIELSTKSHLARIYSETDVRRMFRWDTYKSRLRSDHNIIVGSFDGYSSVNELRVINNAIKHEGKVTSDLARFSGWTEGDELTNLDAVYDRLVNDVPGYISSLVGEIIAISSTP